MLSINTNISSLIAQTSMKQSTNKLNQAIERMTTGFKINHASDNAANYSISTNMTTKIGAYNVAEDNAAMGLDLISTAEGTLNQIQDKLERLRVLQVQASNGTYGEESLNAINAEANALVDEINRLYSTAEYNGIKLFEHETQMPEDPNIPKVQYDGFIKEVVKRDTSTMTTLASIDANVALADGTYSISTPEEMKKLADMTNAGLVSAGDEFVLAKDIDLSQYENWTPIGNPVWDESWGYVGNYFKGCFDGNGFTIHNLKINKYDKNVECVGLFSYCQGTVSNPVSIKNLALSNVDIKVANSQVGAILGMLRNGSISNCYVEGGNIRTNGYGVGGILGNLQVGTIDSCYTDLTIVGNNTVGGIVGALLDDVKNSFSLSTITTANKDRGAGGIAGAFYRNSASIDNCYVDASKLSGAIFVGYCGQDGVLQINNSSYSAEVNNILVNADSSKYSVSNIQKFEIATNIVSFQIGIDSTENSKIKYDSFFKCFEVNNLRNIGFCKKSDFLLIIDSLLNNLLQISTQNGAVQNRLESVLEEITIQRENLISSRSTIRDADIADVSSHYIQQQILQQAAATLMATANQSPAIALGLI